MTLRGEPSRWGAEIVQERIGAVDYRVFRDRPRDVVGLLREAVALFGDRTYVVQPGGRYTYAELEMPIRRVASVFRTRGVEPGERVLIVGTNCAELLIAFWASVLCRGIPVLGNGWWGPAEIDHAVDTTEPALVVGLRDKIAGRPGAIDLKDLMGLGGNELLDYPEPCDENSTAAILFTSGSSGPPKGAELSHRALIAMHQVVLAAMGQLPPTAEAPADVVLQTGPVFHIGGVQATLRTTLLGGTIVYLDPGTFDAAQVLDAIERERVTRWAAVPTVVMRVIDHPSFPQRDVSGVGALMMGGSPVPDDVLERARRAFPGVRAVSHCYGLSEAGATLTVSAGPELLERPGTAGRPYPIVELRIVDPDKAGVGRILVRSPSLMTGYWNDPAPNPIDAEGFLDTGDLGRVDRDGYLYVTGRVKDIVIRGGENIATPHVEAALRAHPAVVEVAVLGLPHADLGEELGAVVVCPSEVEPEQLRAHARDRLAYFEVPTRWWLRRDPLPTNATGKVDKRALLLAWAERAD